MQIDDGIFAPATVGIESTFPSAYDPVLFRYAANFSPTNARNLASVLIISSDNCDKTIEISGTPQQPWDYSFNDFL